MDRPRAPPRPAAAGERNAEGGRLLLRHHTARDCHAAGERRGKNAQKNRFEKLGNEIARNWMFLKIS